MERVSFIAAAGCERLPDIILERSDMSITDKRVLMQIRRTQGNTSQIRIAHSYLADRLGVSLSAIRKSISKLEDLKAIKIIRQHKQASIYSVITSTSYKKFFFDLDTSIKTRLTGSKMFIYAYLKARQGKNNRAFPHQNKIAEDLGISRRSAQLSIKELEDFGYIKIDHCNGGIKQGNKYTITAKLAIEYQEHLKSQQLRSKSESRAQKVTTNNNTSLEFKTSTTSRSSSGAFGLSAHAIDKLKLLRSRRVSQKVAKAIALDERVSVESVENAILNGIAKYGNNCNAGYIIAAINGATANGRQVRRSIATAQRLLDFKDQIETTSVERVRAEKAAKRESLQKKINFQKQLLKIAKSEMAISAGQKNLADLESQLRECA